MRAPVRTRALHIESSVTVGKPNAFELGTVRAYIATSPLGGARPDWIHMCVQVYVATCPCGPLVQSLEVTLADIVILNCSQQVRRPRSLISNIC